ncbi:PTS sugar transporter subunit IIA [Treponema sp.]|uniref:PTS sugar transporter subunit IIA n=1 Tax=Treponema sp. TaxID=166 RepID=UPI00298D8E93|nr:PTS sugar transporter subunit IIA [Treponema sp.]MCR5613628.1 PTS sugar transporter subunit IIA [Treponema sp.]
MLRDLINISSVNTNLQSTNKDELFEEMTEMLVSQNSALNRDEVLESLLVREKKLSTGIVKGIAIPHSISPVIKKPVIAIGVSREGIDYDSLDGKPVHVVVTIIFPASDNVNHLKIMQCFAHIFSDEHFYKTVMEKTDPSHVLKTIFSIEESL